MGRKDYYNDPEAPRAQRIVPAVTVFVGNDRDELLLERRSDNGKWGMPGGVQEIGESIADAATREVREETGINVQIVGMVGIYTDPRHVIEFSDGETRQEFSICLRAQATGGELKASSESFEVRWFPIDDLPTSDMSPSTRNRITRGLANLAQPEIS